MKEVFKYLPITTLLLIFFYLCGSLYLIAFWGTFDIDISNLVGVAEIPKSFIMPFAISNVSYLLIFLNQFLTNRGTNFGDGESKPTEIINKENKKDSRVRRILRILVSLHMVTVYVIIGLFILYGRLGKNPAYWSIGGYLISMVLAANFGTLEITKRYFPNPNLRYYLSIIFFFTIIMSFSSGKSNGLKIIDNYKIKYIKIANNNNMIESIDSVSMKLLGFLGDKFIVSSLDNKKVFVLNQSAYNVIEITDSPTIIKPIIPVKQDNKIFVVDTTLKTTNVDSLPNLK